MNDDAAVLAIVCYGEGEEDAAVALGKLVLVGMIHNKDKDTGESSPCVRVLFKRTMKRMDCAF